MTRLALLLPALLAAFMLVACGDDDDSDDGGETSAPTTTAVATGPCSAVEELDVPTSGLHEEREFTLADYETNPPAGGDHFPVPLEPGRAYDETAPLGEAVHLLEHGAVIGWTNDLSRREERAVDDAFAAAFDEGYYQLATVELPELETPFALSAWGALQTCEEVDPEAIAAFIEEWYASPKSAESALACQGSARGLPPC